MHKLVKAFHKKLASNDGTTASPGPASILSTNYVPQNSGAPSLEQDIYRHRKQRGVNLGSWFVLERWITPAPFRSAQAPAQSDLDVARGSDARSILEDHWDHWIVEDDFKWLQERGINTVRLPIGFYHLCGLDPSILNKTEFHGLANVFESAWSRITGAIRTAHRYGIGVLIDLHSAPGGQNHDSHCGTSSHDFLKSSFNTTHTITILTLLLHALSEFPNVVGIELINEPHPGDEGHEKLKHWYSNAIHQLRSQDPGIPIYISDSWKTDDYAGYISALPPSAAIIAMDHHLYRCFTKDDIHTTIGQHAQSLRDPNASTPKLFERVSAKLGPCASDIVVGEWSGAVNPGSLHGLGGDSERDARREWVDAQLALYEKFCAGWHFWTFKKAEPGDHGWSMRDAHGGGVFPDFVGMRANVSCVGDEERVRGRRDAARDRALGEHSGYWDRYPGHYEHWRFDQGFIRGWDDAYMFFTSDHSASSGQGSVPELGFKGAWTKRRVEEHIQQAGGGNLIWEWEHGFKQGIELARKDFQENYC